MSYSHARRRKPGVGSFAFKSSAKAGDNGFPDRAVRPVLTAVTVATWCSHPTRPQIGDFFASFVGQPMCNAEHKNGPRRRLSACDNYNVLFKSPSALGTS